MSRHAHEADAWGTFRNWHTEASLYREIYTRTVSALIAAFVIYLVAVFAGLANRDPAIFIVALIVLASSMRLLLVLPNAIRHWTEVRILFRVWQSPDGGEPSTHAAKTYNRLVFGIFATGMSSILLVAVLLGP
ncbi:hypothetical protein ENKNEFLB_02098 [Nocardioides aquaticus]|uniref:Uncharacterized protein n=1 Tax=Nocardioides aquaticus TaxID=160826 RepID=A0ABX8EGT1_9ACTN|nr:hypothetical protein [Nocardioides aquaticus]QVT79708.1 hypothetical protein ENKNEFLB_02098 [Nocardioides aquaticus]